MTSSRRPLQNGLIQSTNLANQPLRCWSARSPRPVNSICASATRDDKTLLSCWMSVGPHEARNVKMVFLVVDEDDLGAFEEEVAVRHLAHHANRDRPGELAVARRVPRSGELTLARVIEELLRVHRRIGLLEHRDEAQKRVDAHRPAGRLREGRVRTERRNCFNPGPPRLPSRSMAETSKRPGPTWHSKITPRGQLRFQSSIAQTMGLSERGTADKFTERTPSMSGVHCQSQFLSVGNSDRSGCTGASSIQRSESRTYRRPLKVYVGGVTTM